MATLRLPKKVLDKTKVPLYIVDIVSDSNNAIRNEGKSAMINQVVFDRIRKFISENHPAAEKSVEETLETTRICVGRGPITQVFDSEGEYLGYMDIDDFSIRRHGDTRNMLFGENN